MANGSNHGECTMKQNISEVHSQNRASCYKSVDILQQTCYQQAGIRMRSLGLRQLDDDKSVASCQQCCFKLFAKTCYPQACCELFQQVVARLQKTNCDKPAFNRLVTTCSNRQIFIMTCV